jgi:chaperonin GroEL
MKGIGIVQEVIKEPIRWLAKNSGVDPDDVLSKIAEGTEDNFGFNASTLEYGNLLEMGVIDPVKVVRLAVENGASVATMILTTEALITDKEEALQEEK